VAELTAVPLQADLFAAVADEDMLGHRFCLDNDALTRRASGITLTPQWLVDAMLARFGADEVFETVVDCGAGSGRFAIAAAQRWPAASVVAVERSVEMAALLRQRLAETGLSRRVEVIVDDFRDFNARPGGRTLYIGNPPYVRHHQIEPAWKAWYAHGMAALGIRASQLAGLHAHFMLHALSNLRPGDALCFVTAAEWLDNGYGEALRRLCASQVGLALRGLWVADADDPVFGDALVSAAVVLVEASGRERDAVLGTIGAKRLHDVRHAPLARLRESVRWSAHCQVSAPAGAVGVEVGELFRVTRGQVTGANDVYVLAADQRLLPASLVRPSVTRAREIIDGQVLTREGVAGLRQVVDLPADLEALDANARRAALAFIERARAAGAHAGYVARSRKPWYSVAMRVAPTAFVSYMGRRPPVFAANPFAVSYINIAHGLYPRQALTAPSLAAVLAHLNCSTDLRSGRVYGGGLAKFEPSDIARLRVPAELLEFAA
jgi:adenine-specific DNA-methyltransferase